MKHSIPSFDDSIPPVVLPWNILQSRDRRVIRDLSLATFEPRSRGRCGLFIPTNGTIIFYNFLIWRKHVTRSGWWLKLKRVNVISNLYTWNRLDYVTLASSGELYIRGWNETETASQIIIAILFIRKSKRDFRLFGGDSPPINSKNNKKMARSRYNHLPQAFCLRVPLLWMRMVEHHQLLYISTNALSLSIYIYVCVYMYMRMGHLPIIYIHLPLFLVPMFLNSDRPVTRSGSSWFSLASSSNASAQNHWQPLIHKIHIQRCVVGGIGQLLNLLNKANYWDIRISPHEKPMLKTGKPWKTSINSY